MIYSLQTIDGNKGSWLGVENALLNQGETNLAKIHHRIMISTALKFTIMRVRQKISFHAFLKLQTVQEFLAS